MIEGAVGDGIVYKLDGTELTITAPSGTDMEKIIVLNLPSVFYDMEPEDSECIEWIRIVRQSEPHPAYDAMLARLADVQP